MQTEGESRRTAIEQKAADGLWRDVLAFYDGDSAYREPTLLWLRPDEDALAFLSQHLGRKKVISVGCGCGLLERLLNDYDAKCDVTGVEVNRNWWESRHAAKPLIRLAFTQAG